MASFPQIIIAQEEARYEDWECVEYEFNWNIW